MCRECSWWWYSRPWSDYIHANLLSKRCVDFFLGSRNGDAQVVVGSHLEQSLYILIHFVHTKLTEYFSCQLKESSVPFNMPESVNYFSWRSQISRVLNFSFMTAVFLVSLMFPKSRYFNNSVLELLSFVECCLKSAVWKVPNHHAPKKDCKLSWKLAYWLEDER